MGGGMSGPLDLWNSEEGASALVIVTYQRAPSIEFLRRSLSEVTYAIIVDNGKNLALQPARAQLSATEGERMFILQNVTNLGVARALNIGIKKARELGCRWVHLLDDDALAPPGYFSRERDAFLDSRRAGFNVGAVGPIVIDQHPSVLPPRIREPRSQVRELITSGTLFPMNVLTELGGYNEELFVEGVDLDISKRIREQGYELFRLNRLTISQVFGQEIEERGLRLRALRFVITSINRVGFLIGVRNSFHSRLNLYTRARRFEYKLSFKTRGMLTPARTGSLASLRTSFIIILSSVLDALVTSDWGYVRDVFYGVR